MIRLERHGVRWEVHPDVAPHLEALLAQDGQLVKASPAKRVTRHELAGATWFVKRYRHAALPWRPFKFYFKASQARQEWELAAHLEALGIPIVRHVALGEHWACGLRESILVTEGFDGAPLDELAGVDLEAVLAFVQGLHDRGVLQTDLHPGNLLRHRTSGELRLVDLHGTVLRPALDDRQRAANLAYLRMFLPIRVAESTRQSSDRMRRQYLAHRARRCLKHNRDFEPRHCGSLRWWVRRSWVTPATQAILDDPDGFLGRRAEILKTGRTSTVGRGDGWVLKQFHLRKLGNLVKDLFRRSRARRAYLKAYHLELAGIPTARVLATADRRVLGLLLQSFVLMEEIPGARHLGEWTGDAAQAARETAALVANLHAEGFSHRDLKESNVSLDDRGRAYVLDLDGLDYLGLVPRDRALADLARLERGARTLPRFTPALRRLFVRHYSRTRRIRPRAFFHRAP